MSTPHWPRRLALTALLAAVTTAAAAAQPSDGAFRLPDHFEFDATLGASFSPTAQGLFPIRLAFDYPAGGDATLATWQVDVLSSKGQVVKRWIGETPLNDGRGSYRFAWDGKALSGASLPAGFYTLRLRAVPAVLLQADRRDPLAKRAATSFRLARGEMIEQTYDVRLGAVASPKMAPFQALALGSAGFRAKSAASSKSIGAATVPYTIYYGNMHSQTNHSDGGTPVGSCAGAETPQAGTMGPAEAYAMMDNQAGGDFLLTSEHNHMYDGSTGTNTSANPATAKALFQSGLTAAASYRSAHPDFLALYGNEWGVISNGGHLNIINPDGLAAWEYNSSNQLIGDVATVKSDYANLYATMKQRGWVGQFNHPSSSQFAIGGTGMAYNADGAQVMVLAEVLNSSAFSTNTTETETGRSTYTSAWNVLLERGYKIAPTTDQDNHCANWGLSFRNRTGVLLPNGASLNVTNFLDALKARRVFAAEDKAAQLVLTANGHVMGESFANTGALTLTANYASRSGGSASRVQFFEGVPGRNGTVTQLFEGAGTTSFTPAQGDHFYYALVTEADGDRLWSAPVWVTQGAGGGDTTAPTVGAGESGVSGTINFTATASDNVGVTNVEFLVDGALKGSDASSPYTLALDSTTLANGSHSLTAKAYDAAGNVGTSSAVSFTVNNTVTDTTAPTVSASESGSTGTITLSATASDNIGVASVEFFVDGVSKGTDTTSPYSLALAASTLANGSHTLVAKTKDAAGNLGTSSTVTFTISNPVAELIINGGFESGSTGWTTTSGVIDSSASPAARTGSYKAWLNGYGSVRTDTVLQTVAIPSTASTANLSFGLWVQSDETTTTTAYDTLKVQVRNSSGTVLATLKAYSNLDKGSGYVVRSFDLSAYKGQTVQVYFVGIEDSSVKTSFLVDDVSIK